jgi:hypothetical protein
MDLVQQRTIGRPVTGTRPRYIAVAVAASAVVAAAVAAGLLIAAMAAGPTANGAIGSPEWRQFRASEQRSALQADPFLQQSLVDFRNSEHAEAPR